MRFNRREFLRLSGGLSLGSLIPFCSNSRLFAEEELNLKILPIDICVGAEKPFKAIHISDSHFCFVDDRENQLKKDVAKKRIRYFSRGEKSFDAALAYAKKINALFLHTGDLIDFVSEKNLEVVAEKFRNTYSFVSTGNHEFSQYVGEAKEDAGYKAQSFDRVQKAFPNPLNFCSRIVNGVNFVAFDDSYYNITAEQHDLFKKEVAKGLPIVALCHCPLYTPDLFDFALSHPKVDSAYIVGAPDERIKNYPESRRKQQKADESTLDFLAWLKDQPLLKALLCGHLHRAWSGPFSKTAMLHVVGANFKGIANEISFH